MNIVVIAGSPKGETSVTMQYVNWLAKNFTDHSFEVVQVAQPIRKLEQNPEEMARIAETVKVADGVLWAFPLYIALVHAGMKRFIELIRERGISDAFHGKHAAILATSIHYFDHMAVEYLRGISEDLGMSVDEVFSAEMNDLTKPGGAKQLALFFQKWVQQIESGILKGRRTAPIRYEAKPYLPVGQTRKPHPIKVGVVTQSGVNTNLDSMVSEISARFSQVELIDLSAIKIAGNCTGCLHCGHSYQCRYEGKDDVIEAWRSLKECDAVLFCGFVVDRFLSARWKTFIDRMFYSTHTPVMPGMPLGFVVAGPLRQLDNLRAILEWDYSVMQTRIAGMASDEGENVTDDLTALADSLYFLAAEDYTAPEMFPAIGGRKIFRDEIYAGLNGVFPADHRYYKKHGWYDFPHKKIGMQLASFAMRAAMGVPAIRKNMQDNMKENMLLSYKKVLR